MAFGCHNRQDVMRADLKWKIVEIRFNFFSERDEDWADGYWEQLDLQMKLPASLDKRNEKRYFGENSAR